MTCPVLDDGTSTKIPQIFRSDTNTSLGHFMPMSSRGAKCSNNSAKAERSRCAATASIKVSNDALQLFGAAGYSRQNPLERMVRDARMFTIGGGTAQMLRNMVAGKVLGMKTPQTRDGYSKLAEKDT